MRLQGVEEVVSREGFVQLGEDEMFMDVDFTKARNWYEIFFVWASVKEQGVQKARDPFFLGADTVGEYSIRGHLGKAMGIWERRFGELCRDEKLLGLLWRNGVKRVLVDVLGGFRGVDGGEGAKYAVGGRKRIGVEVFKRWE